MATFIIFVVYTTKEVLYLKGKQGCPFVWKRGTVAPLILSLGSRWSKLSTSRSDRLTSRDLSEPQSHSGRSGEKSVSCCFRESNYNISAT